MNNSTASKISFATVFGVASVWFGTHVGGGFATGNQAIQYYVQYGWPAVIMPFLAMGILALVLREAMLMANTRNLRSYKDIFETLYAPYKKLEILFEIYYYVIVICAVGASIAGAASLFTNIGVPYGISVLIIGALLLFLTIFGSGLVAKASTIMSIGILVASFTMYFIGIAAKSSEFVSVVTAQTAPMGLAMPLFKAIVYSGFQAIALPAVVACSGTLKTKKSVNQAAFLGFLMNGLALGVSCMMLLGWYQVVSAAGDLALPNLFVCQQLGYGWLYAFYFIALFLAFMSTGVTSIYGLVVRLENSLFKKPKGIMENIVARRVLISAAAMIVSMGVSMVGLSNIVKYGYSYCGYLGVIVITIPMLTIGHARNKKYMAEHPDCME